MGLETLELNKDNLGADSFLSILANISEQVNLLVAKDDVTIEDVTKLLSSTTESYSFFEQIKNSSLIRDKSTIDTLKENLDNILADIQSKLDNGELKGIDGKSLTFDDLTSEQKLSLKGSDGLNGTDGTNGLNGTNGTSLTFDDLSDEQKLLIKGNDGNDGTSLTFDDLTSEQKLSLKGADGINGILRRPHSSIDLNSNIPDETFLIDSNGAFISNFPSSPDNARAVLNINTHPGGFNTLLFFDTRNNKLFMKSIYSKNHSSWKEL